MVVEKKWFLDQTKSIIAFKIEHLIFASFEGSFKLFDANITTEDDNFKTAKINVWIDSSSISTGDKERDEHLKSKDFFNTGVHKKITFISGTIEKKESDPNYELHGELTIKGIPKKVKLTVVPGEILKDQYGDKRADFTVTGIVNRMDWGLIWNESSQTGGLMESAEVNIICKITLKTN